MSKESDNNFILYTSNQDVKIEVKIDSKNETIWLNQKQIAEIFGTKIQNISYHISNILKNDELNSSTTVKDYLTVRSDGTKIGIKHYNLDMIIAVGYRVNSYKATRFRIWATKTLKQFIIKGFVLDDNRLKQGNRVFSKDYFSELLEKIREIRASERRFYQKVTDIFKECSCDYDKNSPITKKFYANVQNKLLYAIAGKTSAEIIKTRTDASKPFMGLTTYKNIKTKGKILPSDVKISKNYLTKEEITNLNRLVNMYLDYAENLAIKAKALSMKEWEEKLDSFIKFNEYELLKDFGKIKKSLADELALSQYEKYRVKQDKDYISDFDKEVEKLKNKK